MPALPDSVRTPPAVAAVGGLAYAIIVLAWLLSNGLYFPQADPASMAIGVGYSVSGLFLMAAVPLYLLARFSLVTPAAATGVLLGNTVYQHLYGAHLHPLSSYLIVWPLLFGMALAPGGIEAVIRAGLDRALGRFGFRPLV